MKLTDAVVDLLNRRVEKSEYPTREYPKFSFTEHGGFEMREELKIDFGLMLFDCREAIVQLSEFVECAEYMVENPTIRRDFKVFDKDGKQVEKVTLDMVLDGSLHSFLVGYFNKVGSLTFDKEKFDDIYSEFERNFYITVKQYNVTSPLENFSCESDIIDFGKGLRIRQISDIERAEYLSLIKGSWGFPTTFGGLNIVDVKYVLETTYLHRKGTPINTSSCRESFEDIVTALQIRGSKESLKKRQFRLSQRLSYRFVFPYDFVFVG